MTSAADAEWRLFRGDGEPRPVALPPAPPWRRFVPLRTTRPELPYVIAPQHADVVNAALHLRRPLLVTGRRVPASPPWPGPSPMN